MIDKIVLADLTDDENNLLGELLDKLDRHSNGNRMRSSIYDGKRAVRHVGTVIPPQYYNLGIVLGWCGTAVDALANRCNLDGYVWPDGDLNSLGYREVWEANYFAAESNSAEVSSLIHGPAFLINTTGAAGEAKSLIHAKDALSATGHWNWRTRRMDNLLSITDRDDDGRVIGFALYMPNLTITAAKDAGVWSVDRQTHSWGVPAEALVYKPRVGREWGYSRISKYAMSLHDQALRTIIRLEGHADVFSYPEMWMLGADPRIFKNPDGSVKPAWQVMMGRIKGIPDNDEAPIELARADVKQFQAASPQPHIDMIRLWAQMFAGAMQIPLSTLGLDFLANPTSAEAYEARSDELIREAENATENWSPAFRRCMIRALAIQNNVRELPGAWATIAPQWRSPKYLSRAAQADAGMKQLSAVPWLADTEVGLGLLGLDEQQITLAMSEKRRAQGRNVLDVLAQRVSGGAGN